MFLFEHSLLVGLLGSLAVVVLLARRLHHGDTPKARTITITAIVTLILVATSWAIVTPRERIRSICDDLARLVDEGNVTELEKRVSRNFRAGGMDRKEFLDRLDAVLTRYRLDQIRLHDINVHMEANDEAETTLNARCNIRSAEEFTASIPTRWRLRFSKQGEDWLLKEVESVPIPPLHLRNPLNR